MHQNYWIPPNHDRVTRIHVKIKNKKIKTFSTNLLNKKLIQHQKTACELLNIIIALIIIMIKYDYSLPIRWRKVATDKSTQNWMSSIGEDWLITRVFQILCLGWIVHPSVVPFIIPISWTAEYRKRKGKIGLLDFWLTWKQYCKL